MAKDTSDNASMHESSFLQGHNQAYVEHLYAAWVADPAAVDPSWAAYFAGLADDQLAIREEAQGAPWARADWPPTANGELVAALDGQWDTIPGPVAKVAKETAKKVAAKADAAGKALDAASLRKAVLDSIRAIMYIRSFRSRGHLGADLDPLGLVGRKDHPEFAPSFFGFGEADLDRPIFIDK
ncbi:MAG: 2-oxoglutarate dehydrogenase E1 component, partial [Pseudomonadota bacterium]